MDHRKKDSGNPKCVVFGCYNGDDQNTSTICQDCKKKNEKLFNACIKAGIELLSMSVTVDDSGKTIFKKGGLDSPFKIKPRGDVKKMKPEKKNVVQCNCGECESEHPRPDGPAQVVRSGQTVGVLDTAKKLLSEGKSYNDALKALINVYMGVLRDPKRAKHNSQSTLFNAMKRLGLKKANNDKGYEKI